MVLELPLPLSTAFRRSSQAERGPNVPQVVPTSVPRAPKNHPIASQTPQHRLQSSPRGVSQGHNQSKNIWFLCDFDDPTRVQPILLTNAGECLFWELGLLTFRPRLGQTAEPVRPGAPRELPASSPRAPRELPAAWVSGGHGAPSPPPDGLPTVEPGRARSQHAPICAY